MRCVRTRAVLCSALALALMSAPRTAAAQRNVPIAVTVPAAAPGGAAGGIYEDQADPFAGSGVFATSGADLVTAELRASVNFFLDLGTSRVASRRNLCVAFGSAGPAAVCTYMHWNTSDSGNLAAMTANTSLRKRMQVYWDADGGTYYLRWGTSGSATQDDWVTVTCTAASSSGCNRWAILGTGLWAHLSFSSKKAGLVDVADYQVDVDIQVSRP